MKRHSLKRAGKENEFKKAVIDAYGHGGAALPLRLHSTGSYGIAGNNGTVEILPTPTATVGVDEINGIFVDAINGSDTGTARGRPPLLRWKRLWKRRGRGKRCILPTEYITERLSR